MCKSQNRKCVCKSHKVCPNVCVSHKIENVWVSHKILVHQVLSIGSGRGRWQWSAMVIIGAWRITCKEMTSIPGLKQLKQNSKVFCDLHTFLAYTRVHFFQLPINLISHFENIFCFAISVHFVSTNLSIWREKSCKMHFCSNSDVSVVFRGCGR